MEKITRELKSFIQSLSERPILNNDKEHHGLIEIVQIAQLLSCENMEEAENFLVDRWQEGAVEGSDQVFYNELKAVVRLRADFEKEQVDVLIGLLP